VYDPALGVPIGSGGRYDELLAEFGRPLPAVGFALGVERLHIALTGEERGRKHA
jgi:ATP phosphoribosyltransferase regulatory subunit